MYAGDRDEPDSNGGLCILCEARILDGARMELLMLILQVGCTVEAACRGMWWKALYWVGAFVITIAIVKGIRI